MNHGDVRLRLRFLVPQLFTGARVFLGGIALFQAMIGERHWAATWITYGALTDGFDGIVARKLSVTSDFGALFDLFADYVCYLVAPAALSLSFFEPRPRATVLILLGSPLLAGAIRYARNIQWNKIEPFEVAGIPGLGTVIYAFFIVTLVFSRPQEVIDIVWVRTIILLLVPALSVLMISPIRFSKLMKFHWIFYPVAAGFVIMPFAFTRLFSAITLALGFLYTVISPLIIYFRRK